MIKVSNPRFNSLHPIMSTRNQRTPLKQCIENLEHLLNRSVVQMTMKEKRLPAKVWDWD